MMSEVRSRLQVWMPDLYRRPEMYRQYAYGSHTEPALISALHTKWLHTVLCFRFVKLLRPPWAWVSLANDTPGLSRCTVSHSVSHLTQ